jgi:phosphate transport system substrate-binding protein
MKTRIAFHSTLVALTLASATAAVADPVQVDPSIKAYAKIGGVSGSLSSVGSDTLNNVMTLWAEGFKQLYPNVKIQVEGKGSSTAPPALISGSAQLGPMSREMKPTELDEFEKKFGYPPTKIRVAIDALAIFVNKDNPLTQITLPQADAIFSKGRTCGAPADITAWGQLGLSGAWATKPLSLYGRNSASGTYGFFKEHALCNGDFKDTVKEQPGSASVVQGIAEDSAGIGYSGIGYKTSGVKALSLAKKDGDPFISTDAENVYAGKYPLARFLYVYVNQAPNKPLDPLVKQFLLYVLSQQGQTGVVKDGYLPLLPKMVEQELTVVR